ncbi:asparaginase [Acidovorax lacteus]|uniref:Asparaginase n=1 Tax=Acidovorax lacteus TaxID=1924988 RepID=A0ABP8L2T0_9BURK
MVGDKILVLGTGGTIAGRAAEAADNVGYTAAQVSVHDLLRPLLAHAGLTDITTESEQVAQVDSKDMDADIWRTLAARCRRALTDPAVRGVVITHGTDTAEETAWFLHSVLPVGKPVVLTCAMRPATALTPDGPQNLLDAIAVAADAGSRGVLLVASGEIHTAQAVSKVHPYRVQAFASEEGGPCGWVEEGSVRWARAEAGAPLQPGAGPRESAGAWPWVELLTSAAASDGRVVDLLVDAGVQGLVVACTGNGTLHVRLEERLLQAAARGVPVAVASRCRAGRLVGAGDPRFVRFAGLSPVKARISLALSLLKA